MSATVLVNIWKRTANKRPGIPFVRLVDTWDGDAKRVRDGATGELQFTFSVDVDGGLFGERYYAVDLYALPLLFRQSAVSANIGTNELNSTAGLRHAERASAAKLYSQVRRERFIVRVRGIRPLTLLLGALLVGALVGLVAALAVLCLCWRGRQAIKTARTPGAHRTRLEETRIIDTNVGELRHYWEPYCSNDESSGCVSGCTDKQMQQQLRQSPELEPLSGGRSNNYEQHFDTQLIELVEKHTNALQVAVQ